MYSTIISLHLIVNSKRNFFIYNFIVHLSIINLFVYFGWYFIKLEVIILFYNQLYLLLKKIIIVHFLNDFSNSPLKKVTMVIIH